jgi:hypothetical protein
MSYPPRQGGPQDQGPNEQPLQNPGQYGGQQPGYPPYQQPGYPPYLPPKKTHAGLVVGIVAVVVLLLAGGGAALFLTSGDSEGDSTTTEPAATATVQPTDPTEPTQPTQPTPAQTSATSTPGGDNGDPAAVAAVRALGQKYATAINTENQAAATALTCGKDTPGIAYTIAAGQYKNVSLDTVKADSSTSAQINLKLSASSPVPLTLVAFHRDGRWCVLI